MASSCGARRTDGGWMLKAAYLCFTIGLFTILSSLSEVSGVRIARRLNMTFEMGRDATLTCTVRGIGRKRVIWKRLSDPVPIAVGTTMFWPGKKYRVKRSGNDWKLIIKNVQFSDAGEYECRLTGRDDVADILSIIIPGADRPHFQPTLTTVMARVGGDAVLPCFINNIRKSLVLWLDQHTTSSSVSVGGKVISLRKKTHSGDKRHKVLHTQRAEWSLQIRKVQTQDFGLYTCVVNTQPLITRTVALVEGKTDKVPEGPDTGPSKSGSPPELVEATFKDEVQVSQYKSVTLTCQFAGDPKPNVTWERRIWTPHGDKVVKNLKTRGETYRLTSAQPDDAGVYVCKANNKVRPPAQARIKLKVKEVMTTTTPKPTTTTFDPVDDAAPRTYPLQEVVYQDWGKDVELGCKAVGVPRPMVQWLVDGTHIRDNYKFSVHHENFRHHTVFSTLHVRSLQPGNFKKYECYATNKHGTDSAMIVLAERQN